MDKKIAAALCSAFLMAFCAPSFAKIVLPEQLGDFCVLQQQTEANLWGEAAAGGTITVKTSWSKDKYTCKADQNGRWKLSVKTPAGSFEPQTVTISDRDGAVTLKNVLIGEVWLAGGQSNMEMPLTGFQNCPLEGSSEAILTAGDWRGRVRCVVIDNTGATTPEEYVTGRWAETSPVTARGYTAVGWFFAQGLCSALDVPVGIIECDWGGSAVEGWLPREITDTYPENTLPCGRHEPFRDPEGWYNCTSNYVMYNGMLHPISKYTVKGFIWYQGETNFWLYRHYPERLATMVKVWRDLWGEGELPFYQVELAPYLRGGDDTMNARMREAQHKAAREIPSCGIVTTNDLALPYEGDQIHPCRKKEIGQRLALLALNRTYSMKEIGYQGPVYKDITIDANRLTVNFVNPEFGLSPWHDIRGFEIAGEDRVFHPAKAEREGLGVVLTSEAVPAPVAVRYCFRDFLIGNLTGEMGLPAAPFRSDDW